jgi:hypothetical protein
MNELVHWILHSKSLFPLRRPSLAGKGLPERMRSTAFALLGLTAAAGLALVAIFAQLGFPLLEPAPLPNEPSAAQSVAEAEKLTPDHKSSASVPAVAPRAVAPAPAVSEPRGQGSGGGSTGGDAGSGDNTAIQLPAPPVSTPEAPTDGGGAPAPAPAPASPPGSAPVSSPKPTSPPPEATTSSPPSSEPAPGPGNSSSASAAEHASERGIEASSSSGPPAATAVSTREPGTGNGLAKGHSK